MVVSEIKAYEHFSLNDNILAVTMNEDINKVQKT